MTGEIGVHNNGRIGEDCGIGAVTIKELKGLPDCGCGDCKVIVGLGSGEGVVSVVRAVENGEFGDKDGVCCVAVKGRGNDGFCAEGKEGFGDERVEGDDRIEAVVEKSENGVLENGDCGTNAHVTEIEVDLAGEVVETAHGVDTNREDRVIEDEDYRADGPVEVNQAEVIGESIVNVNGKTDEDCAAGAVAMKELKGLPDWGGYSECNGIMGVSGKESVVVAWDVEKNKKDVARGAAVKRSSDNCFGVDPVGNRVAKEDKVNAREIGVLQNGDCGTNGHVDEINVDLAKRKHGDEGIERTSADVETDHSADNNRDMEDVDYKAGGLVEENKVKLIEEGIWYVNGKIGEDCAIGVVTMKEVKGLADCGCGDYSGIVGFDGKGSDGIVRDVKKRKKVMVQGVSVKESSDNVIRTNQKVFKDGKVEGDDQIRNYIAMEDEVNARETGVLQHEDSNTNGHVNKINADLAKGKPGDEVFKRISEEVETDHLADKSRDNGIMEDVAHKADGLVGENKVKVIEDEDCALGAVTMKELKGLPDCCCGDCSGIVGFGSKGSTAVVRYAKNGNLGRKEGEKDVVYGVAVKESANNHFSADQKEIFENAKVEVIEDRVHHVNAVKNDEESDIEEHNEPSYCNGDEDCSFSNGVATEESLSGSLDTKLEDTPVEDQNRKADNFQEDSVNVSSVAAKEEPVHMEVEKECFVKSEVTDSDPVKMETRQENDSASFDNADAEAAICFGSFGQREFSNHSSEDVTEKEEAQNTVPEPEADVVEETPQADVVVVEAQPVASPKGQAQASEIHKKLFTYMIKIPRFEDDHLKSKISDSQLQVDEKTKRRDAVKAEMHVKRAIHRESNEKFVAAVTEEKAARELLKAKRQDIDSAQSEITKVKNAMSVGEIDAEISGMEHNIQHETLPLKEERELINKIRKLKQLRGQMSSSIGGQQELTEALNNRDQTEERLKNKAFWKYRDDAKMAADLALKKDEDSLSQFCIEQVETFMEAWNKSDEFREEYLKSNARRTSRRLGTADGRSLGPNEEPPSLPPVVNERPAPEKSFPSISSPKQEAVVQDVRVGSAANNVLKKDPGSKKQKPKARNAIKAPTHLETLLAIMERDEIVEEKEPELTKEERELAKKAEELRKKEEAEKLLEQCRLEEKAKAKEALERKKRNAERAESRAAQKAQKVAEQKAKEREKRAKTKEKKKLVGNMTSDDIPEAHTPSETIVQAAPVEPEAKPKPAPTRRPPKPSHFAKQMKIAPIPAPLRNRGKRKMHPWMWAVLVVAVLVFVLFLMGNVWNLF